MTAADEPPFGDDLFGIVARLVEPYVQRERMPDFLAGLRYLAYKRARMLNRETRSMDVLHGIFICGSCPWLSYYPPEYMERLSRIREYIFAGAAAGNFERLDAAIPSATLLFLTERVYELHAQLDVAGIFRIPPGAGIDDKQG